MLSFILIVKACQTLPRDESRQFFIPLLYALYLVGVEAISPTANQLSIRGNLVLKVGI